MSEQHKRCQHMNCCWRVTGSICRPFRGCISSAVGCLGRPFRRLTRRRQREYVRDDRAGVELVSVQQMNGTPSACLRPCPIQLPVLADDNGPREVQPFHSSWYPRYPTLLAISKALDELENAPKEKQQERKDIGDKPEEPPNCEVAESMPSTSKKKQQESEQQYDWDVWSVESLEWNFEDEEAAKSGSSPSFG